MGFLLVANSQKFIFVSIGRRARAYTGSDGFATLRRLVALCNAGDACDACVYNVA